MLLGRHATNQQTRSTQLYISIDSGLSDRGRHSKSQGSEKVKTYAPIFYIRKKISFDLDGISRTV